MMHKSGRNDTITPGASVKDVTLGDYIARKSEPPKNKLTFEEWWVLQGFHVDKQCDPWKHEFKLCWKAAQENV